MGPWAPPLSMRLPAVPSGVALPQSGAVSWLDHATVLHDMTLEEIKEDNGQMKLFPECLGLTYVC